MGRNIISFELRKNKDDDITAQLEKMTTDVLSQSDIVRNALRFYFAHLNNTLHTTPHTLIEHPSLNISPDIKTVELLKKEKDDTQLDAAIDDLLNF